MGADNPDESFVIGVLTLDGPMPDAWTIGDDAVLVAPGTAVTVDTMVEHVHFDERTAPAALGYKLVAVNVSDIAAMGFAPTWATLSLSLPEPLDRAWVTEFSRGLHGALSKWGVRLCGGDTTRSPGPVVASLTMAGVGERVLTRAGGRPGDTLWVTGELGCAAAGFLGVVEGLPWLLHPDPPVALGPLLAHLDGVHAAMDLTDGLHRDLDRLARASGTGAVIRREDLPGPDFVTTHPQALALQVAFGDDYQLLFAAAPAAATEVKRAAAAAGVAVSPIGELTEATDVVLESTPWPPPLFSHFSEP